MQDVSAALPDPVGTNAMDISPERTIGSIVADDYRAAAVLTAHGIDFCCKGGRTVEEVCRTKGLDPDALASEIDEALARDTREEEDLTQWSMTRLVEHIETVHHKYIRSRIPVLKQYLETLCLVHGDRHPELAQIGAEFNDFADALDVHMKKEELVLFPFATQLEKASEEGTPLPHPHFGTVANPVSMLMEDHNAEGERFRRMARLSYGYANPPDGCSTYSTTMAMLKELEEDLHRHVHLENNILFPRALALEQQLNKA